MRKFLSVLLSLALGLSLVGCAAGTPAKDTATPSAPHILTKEEVRQIVFTHANVPADKATDLEITLDEEDGAIYYDLEFDYGKDEYDYRVDAISGKILYSKAEPRETAPAPTEAQPDPTEPAQEPPAQTQPADTKPADPKPSATGKKKIGVTAAKNAAFQHAGIKASDAWDVEVDLDTENGKLVYEVSFDAGGYDYDYEIDAYSGKVLRSEKERDD